MNMQGTDTTALLVSKLTGQAPELQSAVSDALGVDGPPTAADAPVDAFHIESSDTTGVCYMLAERRFLRVEATKDGRTMIVAIAAPRIREVIEMRESTSVTLVVEVEADVSVETTVGQSLTGPQPSGEDLPDGTQLTRSEARTVITPTSYTMKGTGADAASIKLLARKLRKAL